MRPLTVDIKTLTIYKLTPDIDKVRGGMSKG